MTSDKRTMITTNNRKKKKKNIIKSSKSNVHNRFSMSLCTAFY